jgi:hypothetical protein
MMQNEDRQMRKIETRLKLKRKKGRWDQPNSSFPLSSSTASFYET